MDFIFEKLLSAEATDRGAVAINIYKTKNKKKKNCIYPSDVSSTRGLPPQPRLETLLFPTHPMCNGLDLQVQLFYAHVFHMK